MHRNRAARPIEAPSIPVGISTISGLIAAATAFILALIAFVNGDRSEETIGALVTGAVILYAVVSSRGKQAAAATAAAGSVLVAETDKPRIAPSATETAGHLAETASRIAETAGQIAATGPVENRIG